MGARRPGAGSRISFFLAIVLAAPLWSEPPVPDFPSLSFPTPEKVIERVVDRIRGGDLAGVLEASAIGEQAGGYDFPAFSKRLSAMVLNTQMAPAGPKLYDDINKLQLAWQISRQVKFFAFSFNGSEKADGKTVFLPPDDPKSNERINAFIASVDPAKLAGLKIVKIARLGLEQTNERVKKNFSDQAKLYGASELSERMVLYSLDGRYFCGGFSLIRYGTAWKLNGLYSTLGGTDASGSVTPSSPRDFDDAVAAVSQ